jgi:acetyltransferase-like isoleucine patch superfamily enzyme
MRRLYEKLFDAYLCALHFLAMHVPFGRVKRLLYRLRGTRIGKGVDISTGVFIEESFPHMITIEDNVDIGPNVIIAAHDSSYHCIQPDIPLICKEVIIKRNAYIGAGAIILPGVTIGEYSIVAAGAVVTKDVPPRSVVAGVPAKVIGTVDEFLFKFNNKEGCK